MKKSYIRLIILGIILATLPLRIAVLIHNGTGPHYETLPYMDEINYSDLASNIINHHCYGAWTDGFFSRSTRSPGYPMVLAGAYMIGNNNLWTPQAFNLFMDILNIILIFLLCGKLYGDKAGITGAALYAVFGPTFSYLAFSTPEIFSVMLILLICLCLAYIKDRYAFVLPCLVLGYTMLTHTRPVFLLVLPFLGLSIFCAVNSGKKSVRIVKSIVPPLLIFLCCIPWTWRNYREHNAIVPVCTIAGWHLVTGAQTEQELSTETLINYIYDPEHRGYSEGDYFKAGMKMFRTMFYKNPIKIFTTGAIRLIYMWNPLTHYYRFLLPQAYIIPVPIGQNLILPLPDFEGFVYFFVIFSILAIVALKKQWLNSAKKWLEKSKALIVLLIAYFGAHIIGIPLIQYRYIIEPLILALGTGLIWHYFAGYENSEFKIEAWSILCAAILVSYLLISRPFLLKKNTTLIDYPAAAAKAPPEYCDFKSIRDLQWKNRGSVPQNTKASLCGMIKYLKQGFQFIGNKAAAVKNNRCCVAKLYLYYGDRTNPMGIGDVKLNFTDGDSPEESDIVCIKGVVTTGKYKDIIINVEEWKNLRCRSIE